MIFFSSQSEQNVALQALARREPVGGVPLEGVVAHYRPVSTHGTVYGVLGISCHQGPIEGSHKTFIELLGSGYTWLP